MDVVLVTGASSGMGLHAAVELARRGLDVVATMRDPARADHLKQAASAADVHVDIRALDVVDHDGSERTIDGIVADHGPIRVLVNNAGQGCVGTAEQLTMPQIREQLEVNYLGPVHLTKLVLPSMRAEGRGRIITVTSVGGTVGRVSGL
jgi:NAD(P)-dependent dehydrogenase (short-subunit alcohol dehydrogenase family)